MPPVKLPAALFLLKIILTKNSKNAKIVLKHAHCAKMQFVHIGVVRMESKNLPVQNRVEKKKDETKRKIIEAAMGLFNKQGFDSTTMEQIADNADIARRTLYNYFPVKEAVICEFVQRIIKEQGPEALSHALQLPDTRSRLVAVLHKAVEWFQIDLNKEIYEKYYTYRLQKVFQVFRDLDLSESSGFRDVLAPIIERGKEAGEIRRDMDSMVLAAHLDSMFCNWGVLWVANPELFPVDEGINMIMDLYLKGVENRDG